MADRYLRSTDGSNVDNGSTWALAKATIAGLAAIDTAGDRLFTSQVHSESTAGAVNIALAGTLASPTQWLCGNDAAEPPTALATGAVVATTGLNAITIEGCVYVYGIEFQAGDGANNPNINCGNTGNDQKQIFDNCTFYLRGTGASARLSSVALLGLREFRNCTFRFSAASHAFGLETGDTFIRGGSFHASTTSPTFVFASARTGGGPRCYVDGFDFSVLNAAVDLGQPSTAASVLLVLRNCKLPASWTGDLWTSAPGIGNRAELYNCDSGDTNYRLWVEDYAGTIKQETTIVRTGGASDGATPISWKMVSNANPEFPTHCLTSPEIVQWNDVVGVAKTVTVEVVHDSQGAGAGSKFQDDEIWLEVLYLGTSGVPLGSFIDDAKADVLAAAANQADSAEAWTTTGLTTPVKQKLAVTFTPQEKGFIHAKVHLAKASKTVYVDPKLTVS